MLDSPVVDILLSTYNGSAWLSEQLASLQRQTETRWRLLVRDDGSSDDTWALLEAAAEEDARICLIKDEDSLGPAASFMRLLAMSDSPFFCFCDQDDVWEADKIAICIAAIASSHDVPCLVCSDALVVDTRNQGEQRYFASQQFTPSETIAFEQILLSSCVIGASCAGNAALRDLATSRALPEAMAMHDWWLALAAAVAGDLRVINRPLLRYRQHGKNTIGATGVGFSKYLHNWRKALSSEHVSAYFHRRSAQLQAFSSVYADNLSESEKALVDLVSVLAGGERWRSLALWRAYRRGLWVNGAARRYLYLLVLLGLDLRPNAKAAA